MEDLTPMEQTTENTDRMIAAMTTLATMTMLPEGSELLLVAFCKTIEPAEA
jgi:hypothetical protein